MKTVRTNILINANTETVWEILTDLANYKHMKTFIYSIEGKILPGKSLKVVMQTKDNKKIIFNPRIAVLKENRELRWLGHLLRIPGLFSREHFFILEEVDSSHTNFINGENFFGIFVPFFASMIRQSREEFKKFNKVVREYAEEEYK